MGRDHGPPGAGPKKLSGALSDLSRRGAYAGPLLDLGLARTINIYHGGPVIAAWQVGQLPEDVLDQYRGLARGLPIAREGLARIEAAKAAIRQLVKRH